MKILVNTKGMDRKEWLAWRAKSIGGSDVSVLFGVNRFRSIFDLWLEKTGQKEPEESSSEAAHFGSILEETVKKEFMARTGYTVRAKNSLLVSDDYDFLTANLDGVINIDGEKVIFEAKTAIEYKASEWESGPPWEYVLQLNHYFFVTGYKRAFIAALVGGNKFYVHEVHRDEELISKILAVEKRFWYENVLGMKEPIPDGSKATTAYLNDKYAKSNGSTIELPSSTLPIFQKLEQVNRDIEELKSIKEGLGNRLKNYLKDAERGVIDDHMVSWREVSSQRFDSKRLKEERPDIYDEYKTESSYRRLQVA